ncbi:omptin family outer membrane protease PgtE [Salmonella enterica]|nr:omptin family outer membrane protease PgtE [Salmonella enterica]EBK4990893.1 omptin family outer membrane protease PgtE [Salmonella enterica]
MKKHAIAVMMIAVFSESVYAESALFIPDVSPDSVTTSLSVGVLNGKSRELVYDTDTGRKLSQLDWKIKNVATLQGDLSWEPYSFMTLDARGWTSLASGSGHMVDHDWMSSEQPGWTDRSIHPDTSANYANEYDLNVKGWLLQGDNYKAGVTAGYQETRFSWTARGGSYIYDNGRYIGNFPHGVRGIGYSQRFEMPYIGLAGDYRINDFECNVLFKYSDWVNAHDNDEHYMRKLTFREKTENSRYYGASIDAGYYITSNAKIFAEFAYSKYEEGKGGTQIIDKTSGYTAYFGGDAAGIANNNYTVTAGLQYRF